MFSPYRKRADITATGTTTINFAASARLADDPIRLWATSGRLAAVTALPTDLTISGTAGTRYVYALLAAPTGSPYSTAAGGLLDRILGNLGWNRADFYNGFRALHPGDGTTVDAARNSTVSFVETNSATAPSTHHIPLGQFECAGGVITSLLSYESQVSITVSAFIHGQCQLVLSGGNLSLIPRDGQSLVINGTARSVTGSITLAPAGLTPSTLYYIYAAWSGSAITLAPSATTHTTHTNGVEIKSGDSTLTLVGAAYVVAGPAFADSATQRYVRSWFQDRGVGGRATLSADRTTTSATFVHINAEARVSVVTWANEILTATASGQHSSSVGAEVTRVGLGVDSTTVPEPGYQYTTVGTANRTLAVSTLKTGLAEGAHDVNLLAAIDSGTLTMEGTTSPNAVTLHVLTVRVR